MPILCNFVSSNVMNFTEFQWYISKIWCVTDITEVGWNALKLDILYISDYTLFDGRPIFIDIINETAFTAFSFVSNFTFFLKKNSNQIKTVSPYVTLPIIFRFSLTFTDVFEADRFGHRAESVTPGGPSLSVNLAGLHYPRRNHKLIFYQS